MTNQKEEDITIFFLQLQSPSVLVSQLHNNAICISKCKKLKRVTRYINLPFFIHFYPDMNHERESKGDAKVPHRMR